MSPPVSTNSQAPPFGRLALFPYEVGGHALDGERPVRQEPRGGLGGGTLVGVGEHREGTRAWRLDEPDGRLGDDAEGAFGAAEESGEVDTVLGKQGVGGVPGDAARQVGESGAQERQLALDQRAEGVGGTLPATGQGGLTNVTVGLTDDR